MSPPVPSSFPCFALLDDNEATADDPRSRLYTEHVGTISLTQPGQLPQALDAMQLALRQGRHAVGLFAYELGAASIGRRSCATDAVQTPLAEILLFEQCRHLSQSEVGAWLTAQAEATPAGIANLRASVSRDQFVDAVDRIHGYIAAGDTYQVNYSYRLHFNAFGSLTALYLRLRARQPVPFGAVIALPDGRAVLSLSPELFVRHQRGLITAQPMKGTAAASGNAMQDAGHAEALRIDDKSRAENLMIVDLLRNDLGRIAEVGSVKVPSLFDVQRYSSVLQMTSTVEARLRAGTSLPELFSALFPCGSITGAPKRRTMEIIEELEPDARGIYTGAIGWFDAPNDPARLNAEPGPLSRMREKMRSGHDEIKPASLPINDAETAIGDFCLSVPIRTLALQAPAADGTRPGQMGVGAGIVHDSEAASEYAECVLKAKFLTGLSNDFSLFETMHATRSDGCRHFERHLQRMRASADYFGFIFDEPGIRQNVREACAALAPDGPYRLRLALDQKGLCNIQTVPLLPLPTPVGVLLAEEPTQADDIFLRHKTTIRQRYDAAWQMAERQHAFDTLFFNAKGELTEGGRTNVLVKLDGRWFTPPLDAGVLPGVMRAILLEDPAWNMHERAMTLVDLKRAEKIVVCNSLRGPMDAVIAWKQI